MHNVSSRQSTPFTIVCKRSRRFEETNLMSSLSPLFRSILASCQSPSASPHNYMHFFGEEPMHRSTIYGLQRLSSTQHSYFVLKLFKFLSSLVTPSTKTCHLPFLTQMSESSPNFHQLFLFSVVYSPRASVQTNPFYIVVVVYRHPESSS